jgi:hypothetical protein
MSYSRGSKYGHGRGRSYGGDAERGFNRGSPNPKPVEVGKEYDVDITEISSKEMVLQESKNLWYLFKMERLETTSK